MDYILSPCPYAGEGLARMMASDRQQLTQLDAQSLDISALPTLAPARRIVVFLPDDPLGLLTTLQQAAGFLGPRTPMGVFGCPPPPPPCRC